jgi:tRNA(adenine34) deaminase
MEDFTTVHDPVVGLFMRMALHEAELAGSEGEVPVGAVVVHEGRVVGRGRNACERLQDPTAHAEMLAITAAASTLGSWRLEECQLFVTLEPCPMCMGAALNARIAEVIYAAPEPKSGACGSCVDLSSPPGFNHAITVQVGPFAAEASQLLKDFFRRRREEKKRLN